MDLIIKRKGTSLKLYSDIKNDFLFSGNWSTIFGVNKAKIFDTNLSMIYKIKRKFKLFQWRLFYEILNVNNDKLILESLNKKNSQFILKMHNDTFLLKVHKGRKKSVFKNNRQFALIDEPLISSANRDKINIKADKDSNLEILFLIIMCINIGNGGEYELTFDLGNIGKMEDIDLTWIPKQ